MKKEPRNIDQEKYMINLKLFIIRDDKGFFLENQTGRTYVCPEIAPKFASRALAIQACAAHGDYLQEFEVREHVNHAKWHGIKGYDDLHTQWRKETDMWYEEWQEFLLSHEEIKPVLHYMSLRDVMENNIVVTSPKWSGFSNPPSMEIKYFYCIPQHLPEMFRKRLEEGVFSYLWGRKVI